MVGDGDNNEEKVDEKEMGGAREKSQKNTKKKNLIFQFVFSKFFVTF